MNDEIKTSGNLAGSAGSGVVRPFFRVLAGVVAILFEGWVVVALVTGIVPRVQNYISLAPPLLFGIVFAVAALRGEFPIGSRNE